jgi:hypothetical protein
VKIRRRRREITAGKEIAGQWKQYEVLDWIQVVQVQWRAVMITVMNLHDL